MRFPRNRTTLATEFVLPGGDSMLTRVVRLSPTLEAFVASLHLELSAPQRQHLLELADALLVCEDTRTLAALPRQFLDSTDPLDLRSGTGTGVPPLRAAQRCRFSERATRPP